MVRQDYNPGHNEKCAIDNVESSGIKNKNIPNINTTSESFMEIVQDIFGKRKPNTASETGTILVAGLMLLLFVISTTGFFVMWFTDYYNNKLLSNIVLANNSEKAQDWINPSNKYDTLLKVHIFNYTNMPNFLSGKDDNIIVEDIGPFVYREHTSKVDVSFNTNFTVTFKDHRSYEFLPEKSSASEDAIFVVPNIPLLTAAVEVEKMNSFKQFGAKMLIQTEDVFKKLVAKRFLWGYPDKIVSLGGRPKFGLLMNRNGTSVDSLQINTGEDDIHKFGLITQFNGMSKLDFWDEDECNRIDGTDATMFPPNLLENRETLHVFLQVLCRKVPLHFEKEVQLFKNVDAFRYKTPLNVFASPDKNSKNKCYCLNTEKCMPSGVINATKCYNGAPIFPSFPHFFSGDPKIYKNIMGIKPVPELHQTYADIHPRFAFPINGASRIQINVAVHKTELTKNIARIAEGTILPLIWIEICPSEFTDDIIDKLFLSTFGLNAIQHALKYGTLLICIISFSLIVFGFFYLTRKRECNLIIN